MNKLTNRVLLQNIPILINDNIMYNNRLTVNKYSYKEPLKKEPLNKELLYNNYINNSFNKDAIINICKNEIIDWKKYVWFDKNKYVKSLVYNNNIYDMYIISWNDNQISQIHDHPENGCIMKILDGSIEEVLYDNKLNVIEQTEYNKGDISYIDNNRGFHKMKTTSKCVTLHIYSPPNYKLNIYKEL